MTIENVLAERGKRYGDFSDHAKIAQELQDVIRATPSWSKMNPVMKQSLTVIADKIARICSGDPTYDDNWIDIQGYAKLVEDRIKPLPSKPQLINIINTIGTEGIPTVSTDAIRSWRDSEKRLNSVGATGSVLSNTEAYKVGEKVSESYTSVGKPGPG